MLLDCLKQDVSQRKILILQTHLSKAIRKNILIAWNLILNINSATDPLIITCRKIAEQIFFGATP